MQALETRFTRTFKAGEVVFREGEAGHTMFVVRTGKVRISKRVRAAERTLAVLGAGEFFGEMAVLSGRPRTATATASEDVTLLELDEKRFEAMIQSQAEIAARILRKLARRLDDADALIVTLTRRDPRARVILGLAREAEERGLPGEGHHDSRVVSRDLDELAELLGVKRAELDDTIARMTRVGIVRAVKGGLEIASIPRLHEFLAFLEQRGIVQE